MTDRVRCCCPCECEFQADLIPLYGGVRPIYDPLCPECAEARRRGVKPHTGPTKCGRIEFYRPVYTKTITS